MFFAKGVVTFKSVWIPACVSFDQDTVLRLVLRKEMGVRESIWVTLKSFSVCTSNIRCTNNTYSTGVAVRDIKALKMWDPGDPLDFPASMIDSSFGSSHAGAVIRVSPL